MAILDIFKKKQEPQKPKKTEKKAQKPKEMKEQKTPVQTIVPQEHKASKKSVQHIYGIVKRPHISEKATNLGEINQYIFDVFPRSNKNEIKKSIESIYGVEVVSVNIVNIPGKKIRMGKTEGFRSGYKKAIVTIKAGQKIEIL